MTLHRMSSSLRELPIAETLDRARVIARAVGIKRVTDTTRLDRIGVPVFASIRPLAIPGSLCVSAGKGLRSDEARIGAMMEGIELAYAEPQRTSVALFRGPIADVLDARERPAAIDELCPLITTRPDRPIALCRAVDLATGEEVVVPAERVVFPLLERDGGGVFGSDGNGIASGNTLAEATLHGIAEVMERDVQSFLYPLAQRTHLVRNETLPAPLREVADRIANDGFEIYVRYAPNIFGLPYFMAGLVQRGVEYAVHRGDGLHLSSAIAATRAVCEAVQSRLTDIHGGRDDLSILRYQERPPAWADAERHKGLDRWVDAVASTETGTVAFEDIPDESAATTGIQPATELLLERLRQHGFTRVLRAVHSPPDLPLVVVRILIPKLECYIGAIPRVGPRLKEYFQHGPSVLGLRGTDAR